MLSLSEHEKKNALNEIRLIASVKHPNIIQYKESFIDEGSQCLCLVMEYADGGDLSQRITEQLKKGINFDRDEFVGIIS
jgi:NIMA (never in mitosis gene a)-related kinase 1/4/5